jgi:heme-degrading monooxygenase HmoA
LQCHRKVYPRASATIRRMIIRVVRGRVKPGREGEFNHLMREVRLPEMRRQEGFVYAKFGRQVQPEGERFLFVSEWRDVGALYDWVGPDLTRPVTLSGGEHLVQEFEVELYEAMDVELHPLPDDAERAEGPPSALPPDEEAELESVVTWSALGLEPGREEEPEPRGDSPGGPTPV